MNKFYVIALSLLFLGCAKNPLAVIDSGIQQQSEVDEYAGLSFDDLTSALNTPEKIKKWIYAKRSYDKTRSAGWGKTGDDHVSSLAHAFYDGTGLVCGNFSGFFAYCMRKAGYTVGGVSLLEGDVGHVGSFYIDGNKINCYQLPRTSFSSYDSMVKYFETEYNQNYGRKIYCILDSHFNEKR